MTDEANFRNRAMGSLRVLCGVVLGVAMCAIAKGQKKPEIDNNPYSILKAANQSLRTNELPKADSMANVLIGKRQHNMRWAAEGWAIKGIIDLKSQAYQSAISQFGKALSVQTSSGGDTLRFDCLYHMGLAHKKLSYFVVASNFLYKALEHAIDSSGKGEVHNVLGNVQRELKNYGVSVDHHRRAYALLKRVPRNLAKSRNNLGKTFLKWGRADTALHYFRISERIYESIGDSNRLADCHYNMALAYGSKNDFEMAKDRLEKTLSFPLDSLMQIETYLQMGDLFVRMDSASAVGYCLAELTPHITAEHPLTVRQKWHRLRSSYYKMTGHHQAAFAELSKYQELREASLDAEAIRSINEWETHFQSEQLKESISEGKIQLELSRAKKELWVNRSLLLLLLLLIMVAIVVALAKRARKKGLLAEKEKEYAKKKSTLLKELDHRVSNNLSALSGLFRLQLEQVKNHEVKAALQDSYTRLEVYNLVHTQLQPETAKAMTIDLAQYLDDLVQNTLMLHGVIDRLALTLELKHFQVSSADAVLYGLIVNEVVTNTCKYAVHNQPNPMLMVRMDDDRLVIKDNGPGFPQGMDPKTTQSTGMEVIRELTEQLKTSSEFFYDEGLVFVLFITKKGRDQALPDTDMLSTH